MFDSAERKKEMNVEVLRVCIFYEWKFSRMMEAE